MGAPIGNIFALGNQGGRPPHFGSPQELEEKISSFFSYCESKAMKPTISGLVLYLGFSSRTTLYDYEKRSDEFSYIIGRAKVAVQLSYELSGQTIDIFALKNMGWKDRTEVAVDAQASVKVVEIPENGRQ